MTSLFRRRNGIIPTGILVTSLMLLGMLAILPISAHAQNSSGTSQLTIVSQDTFGNTITGYYTVLYGSNQNLLQTAWTPTTYTLSNSQTYSVRADGYGNCFFQNWADGNTNAVMSISISMDTQITAIYNCNVSPVSSILVSSIDQNGNAIHAIPITLFDPSGNQVGSGYTTGTFATTAGETYSVQVGASFAGCTFVHWADGTTANKVQFTAFNGPTFVVANYNCASLNVGGGPSTINVTAVNSQGQAIHGYYIALLQDGKQINSCFSACSFPVTNGQTYQVIAESFGSEIFSHWQNDGSSGAETVNVPVASSSISLTAVYSP
jgi:hypothetical protein